MTTEEINFMLGLEQRQAKLIRDVDERLINFMGVQQVSDARAADALEEIRDLLKARNGTVQPVKVESVGFSIDKRVILMGLLVAGLLIIVASLGGEGLRILLNNWVKVGS